MTLDLTGYQDVGHTHRGIEFCHLRMLRICQAHD